MGSKAATPAEYIDSLPDERKRPFIELRQAIRKNLPKGYEEVMCYGMPTYAVPHKLYPPGYHVDPKQPLGLIAIASQKGAITMYHMGLYSDPGMLSWFREAWDKEAETKLDMGKSCIRFKKPEKIPFKLIGKLAGKLTPRQWIALYEKGQAIRRRGGSR